MGIMNTCLSLHRTPEDTLNKVKNKDRTKSKKPILFRGLTYISPIIMEERTLVKIVQSYLSETGPGLNCIKSSDTSPQILWIFS